MMNLKKLFFFIALFLYIYNISFIGLPSFLRTTALISFFSFIFLFMGDYKRIRKEAAILVFILLLSLFPILISSGINSYFDSRFIGNTAQSILYLGGSFLLIKWYDLSFPKQNSFLHLGKVFILIVAAHNAVAVLMFFNESLLDFVVSLQNTDAKFNKALENTLNFETRLIGVGIGSYFLGGVISSVALFLNTVVILNSRRVIWKVLFVFLALSGVFIARITYVGILICMVVWLVWIFKNSSIQKIASALRISMMFALGIYVFILLVPSSFFDSVIIQHGFELFFNILESGSIETASTNRVKEMLIFPDNLKSILIGDAKFYKDDGTFYMGSDVGYSRLVFYYGVFGMVLYFLPQLYVLYLARRERISRSGAKMFFVATFVFVLIANFKGLLEVNWILFLFFWKFIQSNERSSSHQ